MMLALGMFVFMRQTLPHQTMQRESDYRWPSNSRIGKRDAFQFLGVGEENITLAGVLYPELTGGKLTMTTLRLMAEEGRAWPLLDGTGMIYGMYVISKVSETGSIFFADGTPRKIDFTLSLTRVDESLAALYGDIGASLTNLLVVRYSLQPADDNHSFGHGKAESLAALAQSMFISGSALFLFLTGIQHLISPTPMTDPGVGVIVTIVALICTIILVSFQRWVVRRTQSQAVRADMLHYQSDVMMNGAILLALGLSWYGWHRADALFALGIGIYILYSALRMGYEAVQSLLDRALPDEERQEIIDIVTSWPGVSGAHDLRTRQSGPTRFIQIHLEMEDSLPLVQAHMVADQVEQAILRRFPGSDVIIHQDPCSVVPREGKRSMLS